MTRLLRRGLAAALVLTLAVPALLWAHARLTRSDPVANARLDVAPTAIRLWFSEAPEVKLSRITLEDSAGAAVRLAAVRRGDTPVAIEAEILDTLKAGRYRVSWRVAGPDGHPTSGTFTFASAATETAVDTTPSREASSVAAGPNGDPAESVAYIAARATGFGALLIAIGAVAFRYLVIRRLELAPAVRGLIERRLATIGAASVVAALLAAAARLGLQWQMLNGDASAARIHLSTMTMETQWGGAWVIQAVALVIALAALAMARGGSSMGWALAVLAALALAATPALGGHAGADEAHRVVSVTADGMHVLAASIWLGSVFAMVVIAVPVLATHADDPWPSIALLVNTFSPVALACAGVVLATGLVSAWLRLGDLGSLWTTSYGRTLMLKLAMLAGVAAAGAYNWRRMRPSLGTSDATTRFRKSAAVELVFGAAVIIVTAILVALPTPVIPSR